jgi:hypothetical protein
MSCLCVATCSSFKLELHHMFVDMFQLGRSYISSIDSDKDAGGLRLSCMKMRTSFLNMSRDARDARRQASFLT